MLKKIIFMGTPFFAVPILKSLYQNGYPISVVYTQPPQKSQRGQKINKSPVQGISETLNLEFRTPVSLKNNKDEREDLMQRTLMRIWEKIETFDLDGNDEKIRGGRIGTFPQRENINQPSCEEWPEASCGHHAHSL